jgi:hypothetical protein
MPRKSTREEASEFMQGFFDEAKEVLTADILKTRQTQRRRELLNEIDALDRVHSRFYNWINGVKTDAA